MRLQQTFCFILKSIYDLCGEEKSLSFPPTHVLMQSVHPDLNLYTVGKTLVWRTKCRLFHCLTIAVVASVPEPRMLFIAAPMDQNASALLWMIPLLRVLFHQTVYCKMQKYTKKKKKVFGKHGSELTTHDHLYSTTRVTNPNSCDLYCDVVVGPGPGDFL